MKKRRKKTKKRKKGKKKQNELNCVLNHKQMRTRLVYSELIEFSLVLVTINHILPFPLNFHHLLHSSRFLNESHSFSFTNIIQMLFCFNSPFPMNMRLFSCIRFFLSEQHLHKCGECCKNPSISINKRTRMPTLPFVPP